MCRKLKGDTSLLGIHMVIKEQKVKHNVIENISNAIQKFGKSRNKYIKIEHRVIQTTIILVSTRHKHLITQLEKAIRTSRKTLYIHHKFRQQIDENNELACWDIICRAPYQYRMRECVKILYINIGWKMLEFHQMQGM